MSDEEARPDDKPAPTGLPPPRVVRRREWLPSLIWLIPIVAALVGVMLVVRILMERGPEIVLTFETAEGLEANKTAVKYKDVQIGTVQSLRLARDRSHVRVQVQLSKEAEGFTAEDHRHLRPGHLAVRRLHRRRCRRVEGNRERVQGAGGAAHRHA
jgi:paraquat-inducible protein B